MNTRTTQPVAARRRALRWAVGLLLAAGLAGAVALDGHLTGVWRLAWFTTLLVLDLVAAAWLTNPSTDQS